MSSGVRSISSEITKIARHHHRRNGCVVHNTKMFLLATYATSRRNRSTMTATILSLLSTKTSN